MRRQDPPLFPSGTRASKSRGWQIHAPAKYLSMGSSATQYHTLPSPSPKPARPPGPEPSQRKCKEAHSADTEQVASPTRHALALLG
jgi:hypothetical protein